MISGKSFRLIGSLVVLMAFSSSTVFAAETADIFFINSV